MADGYLVECSNRTEKKQEEEQRRIKEEGRNERIAFEKVQKLESTNNKIIENRNRRNQEGAKLTYRKYELVTNRN